MTGPGWPTDAATAFLNAARGRDALIEELNTERHEYDGGPFYGCEICTLPREHQVHRTARVVLSEIRPAL